MVLSKIKLMTLCIFCIFLIYHNIEAYDNKTTHKFINEKALKKQKEIDVDTMLKIYLGFKDGINEEINGKKVLGIIMEAGATEDEPFWRCFRHFHDPLADSWVAWDQAMLSIGELGQLSSVYWAQIPEPQDPFDPQNLYSWPKARNYYYLALTTGE